MNSLPQLTEQLTQRLKLGKQTNSVLSLMTVVFTKKVKLGAIIKSRVCEMSTITINVFGVRERNGDINGRLYNK